MVNERMMKNPLILIALFMSFFPVANAKEGEFASNTIDLILNRHGAFNCDECARVLVSGGTFLTKQIHGMWAHDLAAVFGAVSQFPDATPDKYVPWLKSASLTVVDLRQVLSHLEKYEHTRMASYAAKVARQISELSAGDDHQKAFLV